ncbi:Glutaredoxin [Gnomoniopsis smithogilvyi]|uniref:Glutaredoxin n=1 Tax=Gnomoniopsis smithogilvyi TaxID=1191159 RepID=A0A9W9CV03_9PEZI|nr:Glutaredoxin [Gnomoniopsis smithogilvyi]
MSLLRRFFSGISTYPSVNMEAAKAKALEEIRSNPVVVFSKSGCPYCRNTKNLLRSLGVEGKDKLKVLELDEMSDGPDIQAALAEGFGSEEGIVYEQAQRTVPNIFIGGTHIPGGNDGFVKKSKNEPAELEKMLKDAGAL